MAEEIKRTYVIPLRRGFINTPRYKRTNKAVRVLKEFLKKHMKSEDIKIGPALNDLLWVNGIKNPPGKVTVDVTKDSKGVVRAELKGVKYVDFKLADKVNKNASFKEKLQSKVSAAKESKKESEETKEVKTSKPSKASKESSAVGGKEDDKKSSSKKEVKVEEKKSSSKEKSASSKQAKSEQSEKPEEESSEKKD
jgi:large subunit ribosomal protein L31e